MAPAVGDYRRGNARVRKDECTMECLFADIHPSCFFFIVMIVMLATSTKAPNSAVWGTLINGGG